MQSNFGFDNQPADFKMILEMIQSDDIMITWEGLNTLS
jgi:hypothetical protein